MTKQEINDLIDMASGNILNMINSGPDDASNYETRVGIVIFTKKCADNPYAALWAMKSSNIKDNENKHFVAFRLFLLACDSIVSGVGGIVMDFLRTKNGSKN